MSTILWALLILLWIVAGDLGCHDAARRWGKTLGFWSAGALSLAGPCWFVYNTLYDLSGGFTHKL